MTLEEESDNSLHSDAEIEAGEDGVKFFDVKCPGWIMIYDQASEAELRGQQCFCYLLLKSYIESFGGLPFNCRIPYGCSG